MGWTALAQAPTGWNEGTRVAPDAVTGDYTLSWWGSAGWTYFIQQTDSLQAPWRYLPAIEAGANAPIEWHFNSNREQCFVRLRCSDFPTLNPFAADFDGDRVGNWDELLQGTDPLVSSDLDLDGLPDDWEMNYFGNSNGGATDDPDGDGLTNLQEWTAATNPASRDTDGDGLNDGDEIARGTNPLNPHSDDDGVSDGADAYPLDGRRSEDVPSMRYAAIDTRPGYTQAVQSGALGDGARLACWWQHDAENNGVSLWEYGEAETGLLPKETNTFDGDAVMRMTAKGVTAYGELVGEILVTPNDPAEPPRYAIGGHWLAEQRPSLRRSSYSLIVSGVHIGHPTFFGVTRGGAVFGADQDTWFDISHGEINEWPVLYPKHYIDGGSVGDDFPVAHVWDGYDVNSLEYQLFVEWTRGGFYPLVVSPNGSTAFGEYSAPAPPFTTHFPLFSPTGGPVPGLASEGRKVWMGENVFHALFTAPDHETEVMAAADDATMLGISPRLTGLCPDAPPGAVHPFLAPGGTAPQDVYWKIPATFRKQIRITEAVTLSNGGQIALLRGDVLEGQAGTWTPRYLLLEGGRVTAIDTDKTPTQINDQRFMASGAQFLFPVDIDIIHPASGELSEAKEDTGDGGYVSVRRMVDEEDVTPVTKLVIRAVGGAQSGWKTRLKFTPGDRYKIYSDEERTQEVTSEQTEFDATQETTLYFQGLKKSASRGGEEIKMQVKVGSSPWSDGDSLKCTVVQSEFLFQVKAFILYAWTEAEDLWLGTPNPMAGKVAKGDQRTFLNAYSDDDDSNTGHFNDAPFRVAQTVIITPYPELHATPDIQSKRKLMTAPLSEHRVKATSVDPTEMSLHYGNIALGGTNSASGKPPKSREHYDFVKRTGRVAEVTVEGAGKDGALGIYTAVADDIHWRLYLKVWAENDPLHPTVEFGGKHDRYPAYEIIVIQSDGTYKDIHRVPPNTGDRPGPGSLDDGNARNVGRSDTVE